MAFIHGKTVKYEIHELHGDGIGMLSTAGGKYTVMVGR